MLCITNPVSDPDRTGGYNNRPELRALKIRKTLEARNVPVVENKHYVSEYFLTSTGLTSLRYLNFLDCAYDNAQKSGDGDWFVKGQLVPNHFFMSSERCRFDKIPIYKLSGYFCNDTMSPILSTTYSSVMQSAQNCYMAAEQLAKGAAPVIYCLNSSPGHHAAYDRYAGYCFLNNAGIAARRLQEINQVLDFDVSEYSVNHHRVRVAIVDLDYHCGDGTQKLFYNDESVLTVSIHADPVFEYPSFIGFENETGLNDSNLNICLQSKTNWDSYKVALDKALDKVKTFNPDYLIIAFGADTYKNDPDPSPIGSFSLDLTDYNKMGEQIASLKLPTIVTQEGGYDLDAVPTIVDNFLQGITGSYS